MAFNDLNELLTKGYPINASLSLIANHHRLNKRQRKSLSRACAGKEQLNEILGNEIKPNEAIGKTLLIDGFNLLILIESALSKAYVFECADGSFRDLSGVHGSYKRVSKTGEALGLIGEAVSEMQLAKVIWVLDKPVSNSGRLKGIIDDLSTEKGYNWEVILDYNPDRYIAEANEIAVSADSWIIARSKWLNLAKILLEEEIKDAEIFRFIVSN